MGLVFNFSFIFRGDRLKFVANHLKQQNLIKKQMDKELMKRFLDSYLKQDGAFLLRLIAHNTNAITVTEITCGLWQIWKERLDKPTTPPPHSDDMSDVSMKKPTSPPHEEGEEVPLTRMDSDDEDSEDSIVKKPLDDSNYA